MNRNILEALDHETLQLGRSPNTQSLDTLSHTVSLYKSVTNLIYTDLVQVRETETVIANVFCWEHLDNKGNLIVNTPATYSGLFGVDERKQLINGGNVFPTKKKYEKEEYFIDENDVVYQSIDGKEVKDLVESLIEGSIRYVSDGAEKDGFEPTDSSFNLRSWRGKVTNRRTKLDITTEATQDLQKSLGSDSDKEIIDSVAMVIADDINKDIIHKLMCISKRFKSEKYDNKTLIDLSTDIRDDYLIGRALYAVITDMSAKVTSDTKFTPTYVVVSPRVAGKINSSGMSVADKTGRRNKHFVEQNMDIVDRYILNDGTIMLVDVTAKFDYILVGVNTNNASSLYMSNYVQRINFKDDDSNSKSLSVGTFNVFRVTNPNSMSDSYMCLSRYALTSPPYTINEDDVKRITHGDDWLTMANNSPLSMIVGIKLPSVE